MTKIKPQTYHLVWCLVGLVCLSIMIYLLPFGKPLTAYVLRLRLKKLAAYILVVMATSLSTISFQTLTGHRYLTPSILGLEHLYVLFQSAYLFFHFKWFGEVSSPHLEFFIVLAVQCLFFALLYPYLTRLLRKGFAVILLICMSLGTLFRSLSTFMQVLMAPNEYEHLQTKLFASFQRVNEALIGLAAIIIILGAYYLYRQSRVLDVLHLGEATATMLGVAVLKTQRRLLWVIVLMTATATALVGPLVFLGFILAQLTYQLVEEYAHRCLFTVAILLGFVLMIGGHFVVERILHYQFNISLVIEVVGGSLFFYLLAKERKR